MRATFTEDNALGFSSPPLNPEPIDKEALTERNISLLLHPSPYRPIDALKHELAFVDWQYRHIESGLSFLQAVILYAPKELLIAAFLYLDQRYPVKPIEVEEIIIEQVCLYFKNSSYFSNGYPCTYHGYILSALETSLTDLAKMITAYIDWMTRIDCVIYAYNRNELESAIDKLSLDEWSGPRSFYKKYNILWQIATHHSNPAFLEDIIATLYKKFGGLAQDLITKQLPSYNFHLREKDVSKTGDLYTQDLMDGSCRLPSLSKYNPESINWKYVYKEHTFLQSLVIKGNTKLLASSLCYLVSTYSRAIGETDEILKKQLKTLIEKSPIYAGMLQSAVEMLRTSTTYPGEITRNPRMRHQVIDWLASAGIIIPTKTRKSIVSTFGLFPDKRKRHEEITSPPPSPKVLRTEGFRDVWASIN